MSANDDMVDHYTSSEDHYETGLTRIGCSDAQARAYGRLFEEIRGQYWSAVDGVLTELPDGSRVADVGMGLGHDLEYFCKTHPGKVFTGVELSKETLEIASKRLSGTGLDNFKLSSDPGWYSSGEYDVVINNCVFEHVADPSSFARQIATALRPGGRFVCAVPNHLYWLFWNWPIYLARYPLRGAAKTHSVKDRVMAQAFRDSKLHVEQFTRFGVRPPQIYFTVAPVKIIERLRFRQGSLSRVFLTCGLRRFMYLNLYSGIKSDQHEIFVESSAQFDNEACRVSVSDYCFTLLVYISYIPVVAYAQLKRRLFGRRVKK